MEIRLPIRMVTILAGYLTPPCMLVIVEGKGGKPSAHEFGLEWAIECMKYIGEDEGPSCVVWEAQADRKGWTAAFVRAVTGGKDPVLKEIRIRRDSGFVLPS